MKTREHKALDRALKALERAQERVYQAREDYARAETLALSARMPSREVTFYSGMGTESLDISRRHGGKPWRAGDDRGVNAPAFMDVLEAVETETRLPCAAYVVRARNGRELCD